MGNARLKLRYGFNPHQAASVRSHEGPIPFRVLSGSPSAINLMDAANAWQLVSDLRQVLKLPAAASFKHVSPSGAGLGLPLSEALAKSYLLASDALIPFRDTLDRAARSGVRYVVQAGGALRDEHVIAAADEHGMTMVHTGVRLFHH